MTPKPISRNQTRKARIWMILVLMGAIIFIIGVNPGFFNIDRSPLVGFVQIGTWLFGLALILLGSYATVRIIRNDRPTTLQADIGIRLIATGYVISVAASFADFIGIGSHQIPNLVFGHVQVLGLVTGMIISLSGILLYFPHRKRKDRESKS